MTRDKAAIDAIIEKIKLLREAKTHLELEIKEAKHHLINEIVRQERYDLLTLRDEMFRPGYCKLNR